MFEGKFTEIQDLEEDDFDTVLQDDIVFRGRIKFQKPFMIRGKVEGSVNSASDLVVDSGAVVKAEIEASRVLIKGKVEGNINAQKLIRISATGSVTGDIESELVVMEQGAYFSGRCTMRKSI